MKKNICLAIETTGRHLGLSLFTFDQTRAKVLKTFYTEGPTKQTELLLPALKKLLKSARVSKEDLSLIAVDVGPGSFTGVRVGLASARALAQGLGLPLVGISSLEAMAFGHDGNVVAKIPALEGECYFAAYRNGKLRFAPCWKKEEEFKKYTSSVKGATIVLVPPHPEALAQIAIQRFQKSPRSTRFHYENAVPMYLQPSWAERSKK